MSKLNYFKSIATTLLLFFTFNLYAQDINLALNARAWASTEGLPAKNAVDGNPNTRWGSIIGIDPSWLAIDLGKAYSLARIVIDWEAANAEIYEVQGSNDANNWTVLARRTGGVFGNRTDTVNVSGNYRYIRIYGIKRSVGNQWGYSIWELKVYGTDSNPPDGDDNFVPLFSSSTPLEPSTVIETPTALITRFADRARDRHAREDQYRAYDHYLPFYWEHRTIQVEMIDEVAKGGNRIIVNVKTLWPLSAPEFRAFYRGVNTVAEYFHNVSMRVTSGDRLNYQTIITTNPKEGRAIRNGDRMEIEISEFLANPPRGRANYYGTAFLYIIGQGLVPWEARGVFGDPRTEREDSYPIPVEAWLGGKTTIHHQYTNEPKDLFKQMATNTSNINGQPFMLGRRVHHTDMINGAHSEPGNPGFPELANKVGVNYINRSCVGCHVNNGRGLPPAVGTVLNNYMIIVTDANGNPHPTLGSFLQPFSTSGTPEGTVRIQSWTETNGLRRPNFQFSPAVTRFSPRITPQLVGAGLLEAIPESAIVEIANNPNKGNGVAGRIHLVYEAGTTIPRVGRFGWKAANATVRDQIVTALRNDMGVTSSVMPQPDCGPQQTNCGPTGAEISDTYINQLTTYIQLLGVRAQRNSENAVVKQGKAIFSQIGCAACHVPTFTTSPYHPKAELRNQVIHPYTDLLVHDMGPELADTLPEINNVKPNEWRTAPLWNIGLTAGVSGGEAYLHDGRARTLNEAILWHGGEGSASRTAYQNLSADLRNALIEFLKSL
ncbi:di-heme oxidoredictase family protein [Legionella gresilensis]|uniref:di-heme oxidoredictase family protein n=1 Tax=Legionella gresilensis TaxID=91823 RepID=UPI0010413D6D|nr:di-heme oxidoredictase family protein [Legionella gresilensis]